METTTTPPEKIAGIPAEKAREIIEERQAVAAANRIPLPGSLRDAFKSANEIVVGPYKVRPFYDGDFDTLQELKHPLAEMAFGDDEAWGKDLKTIRGRQAWNLCYLFTQPAAKIGEMLESSGGLETLQASARKQFQTCQLGELVAVQKAVFEQFMLYFSTVQGFEESEDGVKKKQS